MISRRIAKMDTDTQPRHEDTVEWIEGFVIDLTMLAENNQRFNMSFSQLAGWSMARTDLERCVDEHFHYGSNFVHKECETPFHHELIELMNSLVSELKLRNIGKGQRDISLSELHEIKRLTADLDKCRKRVVWR